MAQQDTKIYQILPDYQRTEANCSHGVEFWVAIRTVSRKEKPFIIQWCMVCRQVDLLQLEEDVLPGKRETVPGDKNWVWGELDQ